MMERIRNLNRYQQGILMVLLVMAVVFAGIYAKVVSRTGFLYQDQILEPATENGNAVYRAEVDGEEWRFTVTPDNTVIFRCGEKQYGPYSVTEDLDAVPREEALADSMTGLVIREGNEELFRGGLLYSGPEESDFYLFTEEGWYSGFTVTAVMGDGTEVDGNGNIVDPMKPGIWTILRLVNGPELTHKGDWLGWFAGVLVSLIAVFSILFADELFRWSLAFRVRDVYRVEPSDWAVAERYIAWTALTVMALVLYCLGLQ